MTTATQPGEIDMNDFPYEFQLVPLDKIVVDGEYQRPLTSFVDVVEKNFDPALIGTLVLSAREEGEFAGMFAAIDGQTRAEGARRRGLQALPAVVFHGLSQADEAALFAKFQMLRRGIHSFHRFRAALIAGDETAHAINRIANQSGYKVGLEPGEIKAVAALENVYKRSPELLERVLLILKEGWGDKHPADGTVVRGLGRFLAENKSIDDEKLATRLALVSPDLLKRRASALREGSGIGGGTIDKYMAGAIEGIYRRKV